MRVVTSARTRVMRFRRCRRGLALLVLASCSGLHADRKQPGGPILVSGLASGRPAGTASVTNEATNGATNEAFMEPMRAARAWTTALAPNARGGWNFITQTYEYGSNAPTEWVVLDLSSGRQTVREGPTAIYANSNYQIAEQLRAADGRIFFPELGGQMAYYDPADETVKQVGKVDGGAGDKLVFRVVFGPDGMLYGGTQSTGLPTVFQLDPDTLRYRVLGKVGRNRGSYSYAYYLAADPPWIYVAVGELPWELAALHMTTGEMRILATRADDGFMQFEPRPEGLTVKLTTGLRTPRQVTEVMWCADGQVFPFDPGRKPPFAPRAAAPRDHPLARAPEVDVSEVDPGADGIGRVRWRLDATATWRDATFRVRYTAPIDIDSLVALPDGTLLGSATQYHGFFRYDPAGRSLRLYRSLGISGGPRTVLGGVTYLAGYPNGALYAYDPRKPWTATREPRPAANPSYLGNFAAAGAHYAYFLEPSSNGRLYYAGRRERDGVGGGIGYYDVATRRFAGHHEHLDTLDPRGFVVLEDPSTLVYSGRTTDATGAQLVVFDPDLRELGRQTVIPGMTDTGRLFATAEKRVIIGVSTSDHVIYRHDVAAGTTPDQRQLPGAVVAATQRASDRSIWIVLDKTLWRYDAATLEGRRVRELPGPLAGAGLLVWQGDRLFWATASQLREITTALEY